MNSKTHDEMVNDTMMTWQNAQQKQYAFTLRRTNLKKGVEEDDYFGHLNKFAKYGIKLIDYSFETTAGLHMHGILEVPVNFDYCKRMRVRGWNIRVEELYNEEGWRIYYLKDQKINEDEMIDDEGPPLVLTRSLFRP